MKKTQTNFLFNEMIGFENFIFDYLFTRNIKFNRNIQSFDGQLPNGLDNYFNEGCFLEIKYSNNLNLLKNYARTHSDVKLILISIANQNIFDENCIILGVPYIKNIIKQYPHLWWNFGAEVIDDNSLNINYNDNTISMSKLPLAYKEVKLSVFLNLDSVDELSVQNIKFFKKLTKYYDKTSLIIGNGVSIPFGSYSWEKLANTLFDFLTPFYVDNLDSVKKFIGESNYFTSSMAKETIDKKVYDKALYNCIYEKYDNRMHTDNTMIRSITKIKAHNNVNLYTYNYDQFIENDYKKLTSTEMYSITCNSEDKKNNEPKIYHLHGLVNFKTHKLKRIILTETEYFSAYKGHNFTSDRQLNALKNDLCLFVGSSMSDLFQLSLISKVKSEKLKNKESWKCFALMSLSNFSCKDKVAIYNFYIKKGIYLIFVDGFDKLPSTLTSLFENE